jgi:hypothetical protein
MHQRHGGHRSEIDDRSTELWEHFASCGLERLSLQIIDCMKQGEDEALMILDGYWQNLWATFKANDGNINVRNEWSNYVGQQPIFFFKPASKKYTFSFFLVCKKKLIVWNYLSMNMGEVVSRN